MSFDPEPNPGDTEKFTAALIDGRWKIIDPVLKPIRKRRVYNIWQSVYNIVKKHMYQSRKLFS